VTVNGSEARLSDGTLAGSVTTLLDGVRNVISYGIPEEDAFRMATQTPAELLGINKGKIAACYDADFIVLDNKLSLLHTVIGGEIYK
ncbi:MAG: amidohydrolase family protein, partial [Clostridia bacterium]|nr:amidohydrolase family protein [Clostridia bacterium]